MFAPIYLARSGSGSWTTTQSATHTATTFRCWFLWSEPQGRHPACAKTGGSGTSGRFSYDIRRVWWNPPTPPKPNSLRQIAKVELGETTCIVLFAAQPRLWLLYCVQSAVRVSAATLVRRGQRSRTDRKSTSKRNSARKANSQEADSRPETSVDSPRTPPWPPVLRECAN